MKAYPGHPRRRARESLGVDVMFVVPAWTFADAYSAHAPTYVDRFDHASWTLRATGLGVVHASEIAHVLMPAVGHRMQQTSSEFATTDVSHDRSWSNDWPATRSGGGRPASSDLLRMP
jgi:para-nitrobenzyl esterase